VHRRKHQYFEWVADSRLIDADRESADVHIDVHTAGQSIAAPVFSQGQVIPRFDDRARASILRQSKGGNPALEKARDER
jgi:hypothetical protein